MKRKQSGKILLIVLLVLCLAGVGLLGAEAWRILSERRGGSDWHDEELNYIVDLAATSDPSVTDIPIDPEATPEAEAFEELEPAVLAGLENLLRSPSPTEATVTAEQTKKNTPAPVITNAPTKAPTKAPIVTEVPFAQNTEIAAIEPLEPLPALTMSPDDEMIITKTPATATPAVTSAPADTPAATGEPVCTPVPVVTATPTPAPTATPEPTATPTPAPTPTPKPTATPSPTPAPTPTPIVVGRSVVMPLRYSMDFAQLEHLNGDVRGWLIAEDTSINYPLVQAKDNVYYLDHMFNRYENKTGAIFMDCGNARYFTDMCTWVYGHNRKDETMFGILPRFKDQDFFDEHDQMTLLTPVGDYLVELFACIRSSVEIEATWRQKNFASRQAFEEYVSGIREMSVVESDVDVLWGDQMIALCTCTNIVHEERYVVFGVMRPIIYNTGEAMSVTQLELEQRESYTKTVEIPGRGEAVYYAQNDPTWYNLIYEGKGSDRFRNLGQSGCGPTTLAMAIANVADDEQLKRLLACPTSNVGYSLCTCSVNEYYCNKKHVQMEIRTLEAEKRYLPVLLANFATGNNLWNVVSRSVNNGGTDPNFYYNVAHACSLDYTYTKDIMEMVEALQAGAVVITTTGGESSPFTGGGHYLTLIHMDDQYFYFLDPFYKEDYSKTDRRHVLEVLEPGVVRARIENVDKLFLIGFHIFRQRDNYVPPQIAQ